MLEKRLEGRWRIVEMDRWDKKFIDLVEPGYIEFIDSGFGSFHFGCVYANIDYRVEQGKAEFSFYGDDEGQEVFGRGRVQIDNKKSCVEKYCFMREKNVNFKLLGNLQQNHKTFLKRKVF